MLEPGFAFGLKQPFVEAGMLLPLVAAALFAGQHWGMQPGRPVATGAAFSVALAIALWVSLTEALPLPAVPWPSLLAAAVGGLAAALGRNWPTAVAVAVMTALGAGTGLGAVPPPAAASSAAVLPWPLALGMFAGTVVALLAGASVLRRLRWPWAHIGLRIVASWVAAASSIVLALAVAKGTT
jgi:hypothetical protein